MQASILTILDFSLYNPLLLSNLIGFYDGFMSVRNCCSCWNGFDWKFYSEKEDSTPSMERSSTLDSPQNHPSSLLIPTAAASPPSEPGTTAWNVSTELDSSETPVNETGFSNGGEEHPIEPLPVPPSPSSYSSSESSEDDSHLYNDDSD